MNWKVLEFEGKLRHSNINSYGFRSPNEPTPAPDLQPFTDDLWEMVRNIKFRSVSSEFQKTLKTDMKNIRDCEKVVVAADKSNNLYKIDKNEYETYRISSNKPPPSIKPSPLISPPP